MAAMDKPKSGLDIGLIFGAPKKGDGVGPDDDVAEARDMLKTATGWGDEKVDALHEYIMACTGTKKPDDAESADEAPESEG